MKVTDLNENECIHCETEEQAIAICKLMHDAGLKWFSWHSYLSENRYHVYKTKTCYSPKIGQYADFDFYKKNDYTIYKAEQFLTKNTEIMSTVVNINQDTSEINITPKEGFEIDLEKSDLKNGKVILKEVEKKYPNAFALPKIMNLEKLYMTEKYAEKLNILDALLCLRDEYNRIDGFEEGFRFVEENWCISNVKNELDLDYFKYTNKIMHFGKEETAELFLNNFEEQLEQIKEFL